MKRFLTIIILAIVAISAYSQSVYFECNVNTINKQVGQTKCIPLNEEGGYVLINSTMYKNTGSSGLLIYHNVFDDVYFAFDRCCQECLSKGIHSNITMQTDITAECKRCHSEFQNISHGSHQQTNRSGNYPLVWYNVYRVGNKLIISDKIIEKYL